MRKKNGKRKTDICNVNALNGLRVIGAFVIVLFHYNKLTLTPHNDGQFPFYNILEFSYVYGGIFVELFFSISGFCFYKFYSDRIMNGRISAKNFLKKRVFKLWPLYIVTTIVTVLLQILYFNITGNYFENNFNYQWKYIILNFLGIARGWYENYTYPYNAPAWFLSVLILMYVSFFVICYVSGKGKNQRNKILFMLTCLGCGIGVLFRYKNFQYGLINVEVGRGLQSFFLGGVIFLIIEWANTIKKKNVLLVIVSVICFGVGVIIKCQGKNLVYNIFYIPLIVFPTIMFWSLLSKVLGHILCNVILMKLDKITYEIYLVQYPYFILMNLLGNILSLNFYSVGFWLLFWVGLLGISYGVNVTLNKLK